jgi:hypothetical protein
LTFQRCVKPALILRDSISGVRSPGMNDVSWIDDLSHAASAASLVTVAAAKVADAETKSALMELAKVIDQHIEKGIDKVEAELIAMANFPDLGV